MSHVERNSAFWAGREPHQRETAAHNWASPEPHWGIWGIPESQVQALPALDGKDVVELGCGTAYFSAWLARRGARPVGVDVTPSQLAIARELQAEHRLDFPLLEADAEDVPLPDESFDLALSEYGASIWCDPTRWIPEAARLLRPGGELVFLKNGVLAMLTAPEDASQSGTTLLRDYYGMGRFDWADDGTTEFNLGYGDTIRLLRANGLEVERLLELQAPPAAQTHPVYDFVTAEWARQWPSEEIWIARKHG